MVAKRDDSESKLRPGLTSSWGGIVNNEEGRFVMFKLSTFEALKQQNLAEGRLLTDKELAHLHELLLEFWGDVYSICKKEGIEVILCGGGCLGAIRHGGFIPWDDDLDIAMTREGYERFRKPFLTKFGHKYEIYDLGSDPSFELAFPQIYRKNTTLMSIHESSTSGANGIHLDIFILENVPNNAIIRKVHGLCSMGVGLLTSCRRFAHHRQSYLKVASNNPSLAKVIKAKIVIGTAVSFMSVRKWLRLWDLVNGVWGDRNSKYVTIPSGRKHYFGEMQCRQDVFPAKKIKFQGVEAMVPANPYAYLKSLYGNFMEIPSPENRERNYYSIIDFGETAPKKQ